MFRRSIRFAAHPAVLVAVLATLALAACAPAVEAPRQIAQYTIQDFLATTSYRGASFSPDKTKVLVSSDVTGIFNAYEAPVDGSPMQPLTESTGDSIFGLSYFPADERVLYQSDQGGNEQTHLYVRQLDGTEKDLTPGDNVKAQFLGWSQDDGSFFVGTNERDPRFFDIYEYGVDGYERELLYQDETGYQFADISADKSSLAFAKPNTTADSDIFLYDRKSRKMKHLTPHEGDVANTPQAFSPDGKSLYFTTDEGAEFAYLVRHDLASGKSEELVKPDWDVAYANPSKNGKYLVVGINNDGSTEVRVYETATMETVELPAMPDADINSVSIARSEDVMAFYVSSSSHPRDLYVYTMGGEEPRSLTRSLSKNIEPADLVDGEVVRFASYDGVEVPGILYRPHQATADHKVPALVWVHGGPGGQSRVGYSGLIQYLVNHGYAIYAINNRGSSGYGKTFYTMDDQKHGEADLGDCVASKQMLIDTGYVDADRIGIIGGSYGGYMVLAALTMQPEEFAVGVDIFGVANWVRTLESIPPYWESFRQALYKEMGDPETDRERLERISPVLHADQIVRPLMVLQGANDPRVLQAESDDIVEAARANGATVEYIVFDDEGHGFRKKENQNRGYHGILQFLDEHLKGEAADEHAGA